MYEHSKKKLQENLNLLDALITDPVQRKLLRKCQEILDIEKQNYGVASLHADDIARLAEDTAFEFITYEDITKYGDLMYRTDSIWNYLETGWQDAMNDLNPNIFHDILRKQLAETTQVAIWDVIYYGPFSAFLGKAFTSYQELTQLKAETYTYQRDDNILPQELWRPPEIFLECQTASPEEAAGDPEVEFIIEGFCHGVYEGQFFWEIEHNILGLVYRPFTIAEGLKYEKLICG